MALIAPLANAGSFVAFESGPVRPMAMSEDGLHLYAVNIPDNRLEIFEVAESGLSHIASVPVGMEPVAVAARGNSEAWVVNHLSDSVSIVRLPETGPRRRRAHAVRRRRAARHRVRRTGGQSGFHHDSEPEPAAHARQSRTQRRRLGVRRGEPGR
jgi:6-phosphogluconolactonase (cycloisomerase 2 family)